MLEMDTYGKGISAARLDRTQEDLNKYRQRIDANVEYQKEYSDLISALQQKVYFIFLFYVIIKNCKVQKTYHYNFLAKFSFDK